ncbi:MAG: bifunctional pyr operon transcriptional regulator/uracil phosphoribosyltransferase PyrR [Endomicrobium sp.]|jgi:pyrimidine operon attenuation protein/uracil phosphoribosyltransferase|nr:bifunctional pyr operon transcriptional regulator/uracil phosphoribosyltransferase PyrR [Endomicrobium sp.]
MLKTILDSDAFQDAVSKISKKILNNNQNINELAFVGVQRKGVFLAKKILSEIAKLAKTCESQFPFGTLDITLYRDDLDNFSLDMPLIKDTVIPFDISRKNIILIDDVLYTGRTIRAALDVLVNFGRPKSIQLAVLVDRGFRELPIEANYVGVKCQSEKFIKVECEEIDGVNKVMLN